ncbi:hypothetical protein KBY67_03900 [Synechococcus sp. RedBA-s]|nr:hypothetical protein [Synechococcus sp. RedBA-s]
MDGEPPVTRRRLQRQLPGETRHWLECRLHALENLEQFEEAYALRMEMAEWLLEGGHDQPVSNLTVARLLRDGTVLMDSLLSDPT